MHTAMIATLLHPADLSLGEWAGLLGMFLGFIVLPIAIIGFVVFKVVSRHSAGRASAESQESITLGLSDPTRK